MKYVKKPIPVEAVQWNGEANPLVQRCNCGSNGACSMCGKDFVQTLHGPVALERGDWVLGPGSTPEDFWPVRKHVFDQTYVPAE